MPRSSFDVLAELFARDVDLELLRASVKKSFSERLAWLEEMQSLARKRAVSETPARDGSSDGHGDPR